MEIVRTDVENEDGIAGPGILAEIAEPFVPSLSGSLVLVDAFLEKHSRHCVPAGFRFIVGVPGGIAAWEIERRIRTTEVIEADRIDWRQFDEAFIATEIVGFEALIVLIDEIAEMLQVLPPVVVRIRCDLVAVLVSSSDGIVVGKIARIHGERDEQHGDEEESKERPDQIAGLFHVAPDEVGERLGDEEIEEWQYREEMTEADIEIAGDADVGVEEDEEKREILGDTRLERLGEDSEEVGCLLAGDRLGDPEERVTGGDEEEEEEWERFFEGEYDREVIRGSGI